MKIAADAGDGGTGEVRELEAGGQGGGGRHPDRSASPIPPVDPYNFTKWAMVNIEIIPFGSMKFAEDITFTSNRAYHAASLVFYLSPMLAEQYPEQCASLHAGWGAVFGKTMCMEQLRRPPEIGPTA